MQPGQSGLQARPLIFNNLQTVSRLSNGLSDIVGTESIGSSSPRPPHQSILAKGDHYLLIFWRQNPFRGTPRMWRPYILVVLAATSFYLLTFLFFGNRDRMRRGQQAPIDKYIPSLSPLVQHTLQFLFLLVFLLAVFPQLFSKLASLLRGFLQPASLARRQK
jgi:hypothetical protein